MQYTIKIINCQYFKKAAIIATFLALCIAPVLRAYAQQANNFEYTQEQLQESFEGALTARQALLDQLTNTTVKYKVDVDGQFVLDKNGNKIPLPPGPPGILENAVANSAPKDLVQILNAVIAAVRAEIAILDRCSQTFPKSQDEIDKCLADLKNSSKVISQSIDQAIQKLQDTIKMVTNALIMPGRANKLAILNSMAMFAQAQKATIAVSIANWNQYARGTLAPMPDPMPMPPNDPPDNSAPSPFTPVPDPVDPPAEPPLNFPIPRPPTPTPPLSGPLTYPCPRPPRPLVPTPTPPLSDPFVDPMPKPKPKPQPKPQPMPRPRPTKILVPVYSGNTITGYEERDPSNMPALPAGWIYRYEVRDGKTYAVPVRISLPAPAPRPNVPLEPLPTYR